MKGESVISVVDIVKEFPGVKALGGISFDVKAGEIHCLVGENGAGKSTLMKVLSGAYEPTPAPPCPSGSKSSRNQRNSIQP